METLPRPAERPPGPLPGVLAAPPADDLRAEPSGRPAPSAPASAMGSASSADGAGKATGSASGVWQSPGDVPGVAPAAGWRDRADSRAGPAATAWLSHSLGLAVSEVVAAAEAAGDAGTARAAIDILLQVCSHCPIV